MILEKIAKQLGIQPAVRNVLADIAVVEEETPVQAVAADLTTDLTGDNNDLDYTAQTAGEAGNDISVAYVDPEEDDAELSILVDETNIGVILATDADGDITTTADDIITAIEADTDAAALVEVETATNSDGTGVVTALEATNLTDGVNATVANKGELRFDSDNIYVASKDIDISTTDGWVEISHSVVS